jgi:hypothetical protein
LPNFDVTFPWDKGFGTPASSSNWRKMANLWAPDGVLQGYQNQLNATFTTPNTVATVQTGAAFIHGYYAEVLNPQAVNVTGTSGTIVARAQLGNEVCDIYYKDQSIDYNGYEQDAANWEIPLFLVTPAGLVDLRTLISPGAALYWPGQLLAAQNVNPSQTLAINFNYPRIPYATQARLHGTGMVTFSDASQAQTVACQAVYQYGFGDVQRTPAITAAWPGGGPSLATVSMPISMSAQIPVTKGKKLLGWLVTAGTGPYIQVSQMSASLMQVEAGAVTTS